MSEHSSPFEHGASFEAGEVSGALRLGRFEAQYEELFAEVIEDGVITVEERARLDKAADAFGLDRMRLRKLEDALSASYEARRKVRIREIVEEPAQSIMPLEPSSDVRVQAYERRIKALETRVADLERELDEARARASVEVDLSGVATANDASDDPDELLRRLRPAPRNADLLRGLYRAFEARGEVDRQHCAAHALAFVGAAGSAEQAFFAAHRGEGLIRPTASLPRESWYRLLFHPEQEPLIGEIFAVIIGPVLLGRITALRRDKALPLLDPERRQDPATSTLQAVRCFAWAAAILGMPAPPLFADGTFAGAIELVPATTPSCRLGKQALSGRSPAELAFLAGEHLSFFREDVFVRRLFPSIQELEDVFLSALSIGNPGLPLSGPVKARVAPIAQAIEPLLEPPQIDRLRGHFLRFVEEGGRTNLQRWATAVDATAARAGLLLCNDLSAARAMLALEDPAHVDERMDDLLFFTVGDRYAKLRKQLGIAVG